MNTPINKPDCMGNCPTTGEKCVSSGCGNGCIKMNDTPTPRTDRAVADSDGQWSFELRYCSRQLETELTAVTEQRDRLKEELKETKKHLKDANRGAEINAHALRINADKLISVTEQRDGFKKELEIANLRLKGKRHPDDNGIMADGEIDVKAVTEQRDRLAEALRKAISWGDSASHHILHRQNINWTYLNEAREALQSLNQDHTVATNDMIADVKGGADES